MSYTQKTFDENTQYTYIVLRNPNRGERQDAKLPQKHIRVKAMRQSRSAMRSPRGVCGWRMGAGMKPVLTQLLLDDLHGWLSECAAVGRGCPGNAEIARRYEFASVATAAKAVGCLEKQGRIAVLRGWTARQATITATGESTAPIRQAVRSVRAAPGSGEGRVAVTAGPRIVGPRGRQCQWIEGEPRGDDSCKCLRETALGESWCPAHRERVYLPPEVAENRFGLVAILAPGSIARRAS